MKRVIAVVVLLMFVAAPVLAEDSVTVKSKTGNVTFNHKAHGGTGDCAVCHGSGTPGKLTLGGKDAAHKLCQGCHKVKKAGPTKCFDCHKKK